MTGKGRTTSRRPPRHGTASRWRTGCTCDRCRAAHTRDTTSRHRRLRDEQFPEDARAVMLDQVAAGARLPDAVPDGVSVGMVWGRCRRDESFARALDRALTLGRDATLAHGTASAYRVCSCPECRRAHHESRVDA